VDRVAVMAGRPGRGGGDGRVDGVVLGCGDDGRAAWIRWR
jgi:hypothetical protein